MPEIELNEKCGNSPKIEFLKLFNIACAEKNLDFIGDSITDDIRWTINGTTKIEGKSRFLAFFKLFKNSSIKTLVLDQIVTHGREAAVRGDIISTTNQEILFTQFYFFSSAKGDKIKELNTLVLAVK